jgi:predicted Rossmann fold flavoprotein
VDSQVIIVGGGAAGIFGAIRLAEACPEVRVIVLEAQSKPLGKLKVSGGGRCNLTHDCRDARHLVQAYPRGQKELLGPFSQFKVEDTWDWFESRGLALKIEGDGRVFPQSDSSQSVIDLFYSELQAKKIELRTSCRVLGISKLNEGFQIDLKDQALRADRVMLATGSLRSSYFLGMSLGHELMAPVPSLFSFELQEEWLRGLEGLSFQNLRARLRIDQKDFYQDDPALITHWGMSGPLIIRLSAWAARELHDSQYQAQLFLDFFPDLTREDIGRALGERVLEAPDKKIKNDVCLKIPKRFWQRLCEKQDLHETIWAQLSKKKRRDFIEDLKNLRLQVSGKGIFKEEFVTCGGIPRDEIDFRTMESKKAPGVYFAGELLDVDGITGGFNFQFAWTSSFIAANAIAKSIRATKKSNV